MKKHINLFFPQWQGGGKDTSTYFGALELRAQYLDGQILCEVPVATQNINLIENNIVGYKEIFNQLRAAKNLLSREQPDTIFTIGGGCDADIAAISYLNEKTNGDMSVLWFDAHGDLNTPVSSSSNYFYGMPLRTLTGEGDGAIIDAIIERKLLPSQIVLLGSRNLDAAELIYIKKNQVTNFDVKNIELNMREVLDKIKTKGHKKIYIHIDFDVLDSSLFPYTPVPEADGITPKTLKIMLDILSKEFEIIGLGLFEYKPSGLTKIDLLEKIVQLGIAL